MWALFGGDLVANRCNAVGAQTPSMGLAYWLSNMQGSQCTACQQSQQGTKQLARGMPSNATGIWVHSGGARQISGPGTAWGCIMTRDPTIQT